MSSTKLTRTPLESSSQPTSSLSRRQALKLGVTAGGGLLIGFVLPNFIAGGRVVAAETFQPNAFIRIARDGSVTLIMPYVEMGQGTYTSVPMLIAEELEVALDQVRLEHAAADEKHFANPLLGGIQGTGGSTTIRATWEPMRKAGATARTMLITAAATQWGVDPASCYAANGEVIHRASGRRSSYGLLVDRAATLPVPEKVSLKEPRDFKLIGTPAKRLDTAAKVTGATVYGIDARPAGVKIATLAQCPVFGGKLKEVDETAAMAVNGVRQVVRLDDAVAVIGDHMGAAKKGLAALNAQWDAGRYGDVSSEAILRELKNATGQPAAIAQSVGDVDQVLTKASKWLEATYQVPFLAHAAMEPMNCTVEVRRDACEVWVGTQVCARAQAAAAQASGLPLDKVTVHNHFIGGGFGRRLEIDGITRAVQIAMHVKGPVKVIWTREEDIQHDMYRPYWFDRFSAGLNAQGRPIAWHHRFAGSSILARWLPPAFQNGLDPDSSDGAIHLAYEIPNFKVEYARVEPPGIPTAFWRSVGPSHNVFAVESFMDELAAAARQDPIAYRSALLEKAPRAKRVLELAAEKAAWGQRLPEGIGRGVSLQFVFGTYMAQVAEVEVRADSPVRVRRVVCALDCGSIVNPDTISAQVEGAVIFGLSAALFGKITIQNGKVQQGNFHDYRVLRMNETPAIETHIVPSSEPPGGIGEPGTSAVMPAVVNAIFSATGKRLRQLPIDTAQVTSS
jgi:isoquinoline 1-oxidoreductase subunit beta